MTGLFRRLTRSERGAAAIEMAIALPVLILFIYGIFIVGTMYEASAGMQHALGEGARYATIAPTPSDTAIQAKVVAKTFGTQNGTLTAASITTDTTNHFKLISLTYSQPTSFLFFNGPDVSITRSKKVYLAY